MNIGIIISVSEYTNPANNLPGCKKDADSIHGIITKTSKFDDILYIHEKLSSAKVKEKLTDFISLHKTSKIEELFFYFTGHGEFLNDEFYYILSDFSQDKRKQTSLQNEELDNLFRTLKPSLVIKVIDACQSGKAYIKEAGVITKYFQKTIDRFDRCYFLNSSLKDQSSFQSDVISDFTLSFIKSIKEHDTTDIRYKDIIDYISDEFEKNPSQTPFFVVQADYTEKFCVINAQLKEFLEKIDLSSTSIVKGKEEGISILEKIKKQAAEYFTKEQALELVNDVKAEVEKFQLSEDLKEIYDLAISFQESYDHIVQKNTIGKWLDENPHEFFAKSVYKYERKDRYTNPLSGLRSYQSTLLFNQFNEDEYESVRNGFDIEVEVPFKTIILTLNSKFPNVESYTTRIVYFLSKKLIRFFYFITNFETKNWDERKLNTKIEWSTSEYSLHDKQSVFDGLKKIFSLLENQAKKGLEEKFNKQDTTKE